MQPNMISCDELREEFRKCYNDPDKRIMIIDVRDASLYERSHLRLDARNDNDSVRKKMRVLNIDPDVVKPTTIKNIKENLKRQDDLFVFQQRKHATDVVIIEKDTDKMEDLMRPESKISRLIRGLLYYDTNQQERITCPIKILEGGYRAWHEQYRNFTSDPTFEPDAVYPVKDHNHAYDSKPLSPTEQGNHVTTDGFNPMPVAPILPPQVVRQPPSVPMRPIQPAMQVQPPTDRSSPIIKPVPTTPKPQPTAPRLDYLSRNAPGTAVPATPSFSIRPALPRSHSSPNVAQAEDSGDEMEEISNNVNNLNLPHYGFYHQNAINLNNNHLAATTTSKNSFKPIFDRSLKPSYNIELVNAIKAHLNFGNSYEASGRTQTGLQNLGNTCFMNSVIQCLAYTPALVTYFCSDTYYSHINFDSQYGSKGVIAIEFGALIEKVTLRRYKYIEPRSFRSAVRNYFGFADNEQQDSHEFMMMLFDKLHHDLNRNTRDKIKPNGIVSMDPSCNNENSNINASQISSEDKLEAFWREHLKMNKSIISELFEGLFMSTLTCAYCKGQSNTYEVFNCLSLPISSNKSTCHIRECLTHFSNPERIDAAWKCPSCNLKREADKKIVIRKLPKILIIHLKRFSLDGRWRQKLETTVEFPLHDLVLPSTPFRNAYNLYAVVNHYGDLNGGHYTASCKLENQQWYTFSDRDVSRTDSSRVCSQAAYILFYVAK